LQCEFVRLSSEVSTLQSSLATPLKLAVQQLFTDLTQLQGEVLKLQLKVSETSTSSTGRSAAVQRFAGQPSAQSVLSWFLAIIVLILSAGIVEKVINKVNWQSGLGRPTTLSLCSSEKCESVSESGPVPSTSNHSPVQSPASDSLTWTPMAKPTPSWSLGSVIISDFPEIFSEFRGKRFWLLGRGSRDGFMAKDFHRRCDGQANTLTVILETNGNIFGGFTPLKWESAVWNGRRGPGNNQYKADKNQDSFLFTLKNPHGVAAMRFALTAAKKDRAIFCHPGNGPAFSEAIVVEDECNAKSSSSCSLGGTYTNPTGVDGDKFFTGAAKFKVKEIEVFKITD
jgi:hypothetical protein